MNDQELMHMQQQVEDEVSRRRAEQQARPPWRVALDELCLANYENPQFWLQLRAILLGGSTDEDLECARQFYAKACRICRRPMSQNWHQCDHCGADNYGPEIISSTVIAGELES